MQAMALGGWRNLRRMLSVRRRRGAGGGMARLWRRAKGAAAARPHRLVLRRWRMRVLEQLLRLLKLLMRHLLATVRRVLLRLRLRRRRPCISARSLPFPVRHSACKSVATKASPRHAVLLFVRVLDVLDVGLLLGGLLRCRRDGLDGLRLPPHPRMAERVFH